MLSRPTKPRIESHPHGPQNAEHELKKAYNSTIEAAMTFYWDRRAIPGVNSDEVLTFYKHAFQAYRDDKRLAAERWARTVKHLSRAFLHEAKIAFLDPRTAELPFLEGASEEYGLTEEMVTTADLIESVANHIPPGLNEMPEEMRRYLSRARKHLGLAQDPSVRHELLRAEHLLAAHEYGRVMECMALAYEAENLKKAA